MNQFYAFIMLLVFIIGLVLGGIVTYIFIFNTEANTDTIYVDDDTGVSKKKSKFFIKRTKRSEEKEDSGLLEYRLADEVSITEQTCAKEGTYIGEVLEEQQDKVDSDFEYLADKVDAEVKE